VRWGIANAKQRKSLAQLQVAEALTKEFGDAGGAPFVEFQIMIREAIEQRVFRNDACLSIFLSDCYGRQQKAFGMSTIQKP